jgi:hypothetical protein
MAATARWLVAFTTDGPRKGDGREKGTRLKNNESRPLFPPDSSICENAGGNELSCPGQADTGARGEHGRLVTERQFGYIRPPQRRRASGVDQNWSHSANRRQAFRAR